MVASYIPSSNSESNSDSLQPRPLSPRKIAANRRNARSSTGPRTSAGKAISCKNAIKHGLSTDLVLHNETEEDFENHRYAMLLALDPRDLVQLAIAERIISCEWRLKRIAAAEKHILCRDSGELEEGYENPEDYPLNICEDAGALVATALYRDDNLERLGRYEQRLIGQAHRALRELRQLQNPPKCQVRNKDGETSENEESALCPYVPQSFIDRCLDDQASDNLIPGDANDDSTAESSTGDANVQNEPTEPEPRTNPAMTNAYAQASPHSPAQPAPRALENRTRTPAGTVPTGRTAARPDHPR